MRFGSRILENSVSISRYNAPEEYATRVRTTPQKTLPSLSWAA